MNPCEMTLTVTALANAIAAELESPEEVAAAGSLFTLLGDTLAAISAQQVLCRERQNQSVK
ncbi:MAG: DUF6774 domain-containing protein [Oscillospiraceae bacterium]